MAVTYFSRPHYRGTPPFDQSDVQGLSAYDPEVDDSYLDVEPETGRQVDMYTYRGKWILTHLSTYTPCKHTHKYRQSHERTHQSAIIHWNQQWCL